jgi:hypothetical protein
MLARLGVVSEEIARKNALDRVELASVGSFFYVEQALERLCGAAETMSPSRAVRLETGSSQGPVKVLATDHIERPSEN